MAESGEFVTVFATVSYRPIPHAVNRKVSICLATIFDARHCGVTGGVILVSVTEAGFLLRTKYSHTYVLNYLYRLHVLYFLYFLGEVV